MECHSRCFQYSFEDKINNRFFLQMSPFLLLFISICYLELLKGSSPKNLNSVFIYSRSSSNPV